MSIHTNTLRTVGLARLAPYTYTPPKLRRKRLSYIMDWTRRSPRRGHPCGRAGPRRSRVRFGNKLGRGVAEGGESRGVHGLSIAKFLPIPLSNIAPIRQYSASHYSWATRYWQELAR